MELSVERMLLLALAGITEAITPDFEAVTTAWVGKDEACGHVTLSDGRLIVVTVQRLQPRESRG